MAMTEFVPEVKSRLGSAPTTLVHGDVRLDNIFFDSRSDGARVRLIDGGRPFEPGVEHTISHTFSRGPCLLMSVGSVRIR